MKSNGGCERKVRENKREWEGEIEKRRERKRERETHTHRERERDREIETDRQTDRGRGRLSGLGRVKCKRFKPSPLFPLFVLYISLCLSVSISLCLCLPPCLWLFGSECVSLYFSESHLNTTTLPKCTYPFDALLQFVVDEERQVFWRLGIEVDEVLKAAGYHLLELLVLIERLMQEMVETIIQIEEILKDGKTR